MDRIVFIIPYFGKFNNYFQLFLDSCGRNERHTWFIITDDMTNYNFPKNVIIEYDNFSNFYNRIQKKFDNIQISLDNPYKLCDFKPTYGYVFEEKIKDFDYWGYCDVDLIFGNIDKCLKLEKMMQYDKIGVLGHFTIFKNTKEIRELFLKDNRYKTVLSSPFSFKYDEEFGEDFGISINNVFEKFNKKILILDNFADIYVKSSNFKITYYNSKEKNYMTEKNKKNFFVYSDGNLVRYLLQNKKLIMEEYMYIHLQKRNMQVEINDSNIFKIIPNCFAYLEKECNTYNDFKYIKTKKINLHYFKIRYKNLKNKIRKRWGK